jgi:hypothetical protein
MLMLIKLTKTDREVLTRAINLVRYQWETDRRNWEVKAAWPLGSTDYSPEYCIRRAKMLINLVNKLDIVATKIID